MFALSKIKSDQTLNAQKAFCVCDIEAHKWIKFKVIGFYDGSEFKEFRSLDHFFRFLVDDLKDKQIFAHFGGIYDFMFLLKYIILESDMNLEVTSIIPRGSGILCFDVVYTNTYVNKKGIEVKESCKLRFNDSSGLLPFSLDKLSKSFDVKHKKGKFDFEKWDGKVTSELLAYLKDDCRALYEVLNKFYKWPLVARSGRATTMASQALRVYRTFLKDDIPLLPSKVDAFTRKAYFGGRTEIFKPYFESKDETLKTYDVNSLYPSVMLKNDFPVAYDDRVFDYDKNKMGVWHVDVDVPEMYVPPLGSIVKVPSSFEYTLKDGSKKTKNYESNKFVFPVGKFTGYWTTSELEYARSLGVKIRRVHQGITFKDGGPIFSRYIQKLYEMRLDAKAKGDTVTDIICKLLMNSLYGRFGMNPLKEGLSFDNTLSQEIYITLENELKKVPIFKHKNRLNTFFNVAIPCYVTSYSRIDMHKFLMATNERIWYTDTDSLFTPEEFNNSDELGELKLEYESSRACFLLPKTYAVEKQGVDLEKVKKVAMKGFDNKLAQKFSLDDFQSALEGELGVLKLTNPSKMARFKTALRKKDFLVMMDQQDRQIKSTYDKRKIFKNSRGEYDSEPLFIRDGRVANV